MPFLMCRFTLVRLTACGSLSRQWGFRLERQSYRPGQPLGYCRWRFSAMNKRAWQENRISRFKGGIWRVVCSYKCAEASGQDRGITLAAPRSSSPLQAIEKGQLMCAPKLTLTGPFVEGQPFGRNGKLLANYAAHRAMDGEHFRGVGSI